MSRFVRRCSCSYAGDGWGLGLKSFRLRREAFTSANLDWRPIGADDNCDSTTTNPILPLPRQVHCVVQKPVDSQFVVYNFVQKVVASVSTRARNWVNPSVRVDVATGPANTRILDKFVEREPNQRSILLRLGQPEFFKGKCQNVADILARGLWDLEPRSGHFTSLSLVRARFRP